MTSSLEQINVGFLPLLDAAILVIAEEKGFAKEQGLSLNLVRETSWANIRDRVAIGHFDAAHMLAPMPIASNLGLNPLSVDLVAPMAMGLGGNAVTVSNALWGRLSEAGAPEDLSARQVGNAMRDVVKGGQGEKLRFGVVHPHSGHNYELRYWLAASGVSPDEDVEFVIIPPPLMPDALGSGSIDGFCVGAPWNSVAVASGYGRIVTVKAEIWRSSPEKVLGMKADWAEQNPDMLSRLVRSLYAASVWCGDPENHQETANIMGGEQYINRPAELLLRALSGRIATGGGVEVQVSDFFMPHDRAATFPWVSHALWFYSQMVRWGQVPHTAENAKAAMGSYRPDLYRSALLPMSAPVPGASSKVEGALTESTPVGATSGRLNLGPDGFFDGQVFDPDGLDRYINGQSA